MPPIRASTTTIAPISSHGTWRLLGPDDERRRAPVTGFLPRCGGRALLVEPVRPAGAHLPEAAGASRWSVHSPWPRSLGMSPA